MSDKKGRIARYAMLTLLIMAALLTGCGQRDMHSEQTDGGKTIAAGPEEGADGKLTIIIGNEEPDNPPAEGGVAGQESQGENAAEPFGISEREPSAGSEEKGQTMVVSPQEKKIDWIICSEGCYTYLSDGLYGYLAEDGSEITPCIYSQAAPFSEGLACVCLDGKYGYIGKDGETVLPFIYDQASPFVEGTAYFVCGEEYALIDREGNVTLRLEDCDSISSFREGLAYFSVDGRYGYMDQTGSIVVLPVYEEAGYFQEGLAVVRKGGFCGVLGRDGREILPPRYDSVSLEETNIIAQKEGKYYLFDRAGKELFAKAADSLYEDYKAAGLFRIWQDKKCGMIDRDGEILLEPVYGDLTPLPDGKQFIVQSENGAYGILGCGGQVRVPFIYSGIYATGEGGLRVQDRDTGKVGYLDGEDFSVRIPTIYDSLEDFTERGAVAQLDGKYGVIRYDGTLEIPLEYDKIVLFSDGSKAVWTGGTMVLTDSRGSQVLSGQYDSIRELGSGYITTRDEKQSCWDSRGNLLLSGQYDLIRKLGEGYETTTDGVKSCWDSQGNLLASDYYWCDTVYGAENTYILGSDVFLRAGEEKGQHTGEIWEKMLQTNWITPRAGAFAEFLQNGTIVLEDAGSGHTEKLGEIGWSERRIGRLYRIGEELLLYFYAEPWKQAGFPESYSGLFIIRDGQVEQLLSGYECGGSLMGDYVCFLYDREEDTWKPGIWGNWGGFGGHAGGGHVYTLQEGRAVEETSFQYCNQTAGNYDEEELLENAELFYDGEGQPFTKETILEAENVAEYSVGGRQMSLAEYQTVRERYRFYWLLNW